MKNWIKILIILFSAAAIGAMAFFALKKTETETVDNAGEAPNAEEKVRVISYNGQNADIKNNIDTLLIIGTDTEEMPQYEKVEEAAFYNYIQADVLVVLVIDNDNKTVTPIQINRDTMCDVPWLDVEGNLGGTVFEQIALAYNSGSGRNDSCEVTADAVSSLLFDAPVAHYLAFAMDGINVLNDIVGGVSVEIEDDMTAVNPAFVKGTTVLLKGEQAEQFVRARCSLADDTNASRMRRHRAYFEGFLKSGRDKYDADSEFAIKAIETLNPYLVTDMSAEKMSQIISQLDSYEVKDVLYAEGELRVGQFYEFYPDEDSLFNIVKEAYCR